MMENPFDAKRQQLKRPFVVAILGVLAMGTRGVPLFAQADRESRVAVTVGAAAVGSAPVGRMLAGIGVSTRLTSTPHFAVRLGAAYARASGDGSRVCVENPCDTRVLRDDWRVSAGLRRSLGSTGFSLHTGVGVSWPRVSGAVSQAWNEWGRGSQRTALGFGQLGIGLHSRRTHRSRWLEAGVERVAVSSLTGVYVRAGFGIL